MAKKHRYKNAKPQKYEAKEVTGPIQELMLGRYIRWSGRLFWVCGCSEVGHQMYRSGGVNYRFTEMKLTLRDPEDPTVPMPVEELV